MELEHYLTFNRTCAEALAVYAAAFDGTITEKQTFGGVPGNPGFPVADEDKDLVLHSRLIIAGQTLMCSDSSRPVTPGSTMYISVGSDDEAMIRRAWAALADGGEIFMDLTPTFFAKAHGSLRDRFGINWMFTATRAE